MGHTEQSNLYNTTISLVSDSTQDSLTTISPTSTVRTAVSQEPTLSLKTKASVITPSTSNLREITSVSDSGSTSKTMVDKTDGITSQSLSIYNDVIDTTTTPQHPNSETSPPVNTEILTVSSNTDLTSNNQYTSKSAGRIVYIDDLTTTHRTTESSTTPSTISATYLTTSPTELENTSLSYPSTVDNDTFTSQIHAESTPSAIEGTDKTTASAVTTRTQFLQYVTTPVTYTYVSETENIDAKTSLAGISKSATDSTNEGTSVNSFDMYGSVLNETQRSFVGTTHPTSSAVETEIESAPFSMKTIESAPFSMKTIESAPFLMKTRESAPFSMKTRQSRFSLFTLFVNSSTKQQKDIGGKLTALENERALSESIGKSNSSTFQANITQEPFNSKVSTESLAQHHSSKTTSNTTKSENKLVDFGETSTSTARVNKQSATASIHDSSTLIFNKDSSTDLSTREQTVTTSYAGDQSPNVSDHQSSVVPITRSYTKPPTTISLSNENDPITGSTMETTTQPINTGSTTTTLSSTQQSSTSVSNIVESTTIPTTFSNKRETAASSKKDLEKQHTTTTETSITNRQTPRRPITLASLLKSYQSSTQSPSTRSSSTLNIKSASGNTLIDVGDNLSTRRDSSRNPTSKIVVQRTTKVMSTKPTAIPRRRVTGLPLFTSKIISQLPFFYKTALPQRVGGGRTINIKLSLVRKELNENITFDNSTDINDSFIEKSRIAESFDIFDTTNNKTNDVSTVTAEKSVLHSEVSSNDTIVESENQTSSDAVVSSNTQAENTLSDSNTPTLSEFEQNPVSIRKIRSTRKPFPTPSSAVTIAAQRSAADFQKSNLDDALNTVTASNYSEMINNTTKTPFYTSGIISINDTTTIGQSTESTSSSTGLERVFDTAADPDSENAVETTPFKFTTDLEKTTVTETPRHSTKLNENTRASTVFKQNISVITPSPTDDTKPNTVVGASVDIKRTFSTVTHPPTPSTIITLSSTTTQDASQYQQELSFVTLSPTEGTKLHTLGRVSEDIKRTFTSETHPSVYKTVPSTIFPDAFKFERKISFVTPSTDSAKAVNTFNTATSAKHTTVFDINKTRKTVSPQPSRNMFRTPLISGSEHYSEMINNTTKTPFYTSGIISINDTTTIGQRTESTSSSTGLERVFDTAADPDSENAVETTPFKFTTDLEKTTVTETPRHSTKLNENTRASTVFEQNISVITPSPTDDTKPNTVVGASVDLKRTFSIVTHPPTPSTTISVSSTTTQDASQYQQELSFITLSSTEGTKLNTFGRVSGDLKKTFTTGTLPSVYKTVPSTKSPDASEFERKIAFVTPSTDSAKAINTFFTVTSAKHTTVFGINKTRKTVSPQPYRNEFRTPLISGSEHNTTPDTDPWLHTFTNRDKFTTENTPLSAVRAPHQTNERDADSSQFISNIQSSRQIDIPLRGNLIESAVRKDLSLSMANTKSESDIPNQPNLSLSALSGNHMRNGWKGGGVYVGAGETSYSDTNVASLSSNSASHNTGEGITHSQLSSVGDVANWNVGIFIPPEMIPGHQPRQTFRNEDTSRSSSSFASPRRGEQQAWEASTRADFYYPVVRTMNAPPRNRQQSLLSGIPISMDSSSLSLGIAFSDNVGGSISGINHGSLSQRLPSSSDLSLSGGQLRGLTNSVSLSHGQHQPINSQSRFPNSLSHGRRIVRSTSTNLHLRMTEHSTEKSSGATVENFPLNKFIVDAQELCTSEEVFACFGKSKHASLPGIRWWCVQNCRHGNCPLSKCRCGCQKNGSSNLRDVQFSLAQSQIQRNIQIPQTTTTSSLSSTTRRTVWNCKPTAVYAPVSGLSEWCNRMCSLDACPLNMCVC